MGAPLTFVHATSRGPCSVSVLDALGDWASEVGVHAPGRRVLVTDTNVEARWGAAVRALVPVAHTVILPAGEVHKTVATWSRLVDELLAVGIDRQTTVLALGGGVVGDVAGFAAATVLRGVPVVQLPTTLLSMVDSALGGKTAVDHPAGKNLVGAFHPPTALVACPEFLSTLPEREWRSGFAEVVKTALALDPELFLLLEAGPEHPATPGAVPGAWLERCLRAKAAVVEHDERDAGPRLALNLGHTVAHGLEHALGFGVWTHGEAVSAGLVAEARFAVARGVCETPRLPDRLVHLLSRRGLPVELPSNVATDALCSAMALDKKGRADTIRMPLPVRVGEVRLVDVPRTELSELVPRRSQGSDEEARRT